MDPPENRHLFFPTSHPAGANNSSEPVPSCQKSFWSTSLTCSVIVDRHKATLGDYRNYLCLTITELGAHRDVQRGQVKGRFFRVNPTLRSTHTHQWNSPDIIPRSQRPKAKNQTPLASSTTRPAQAIELQPSPKQSCNHLELSTFQPVVRWSRKLDVYILPDKGLKGHE